MKRLAVRLTIFIVTAIASTIALLVVHRDVQHVAAVRELAP